MKKIAYLPSVFMFFVLFLVACVQPLNQDLDLEQALAPSIESSNSALQLFCEQSSSIDACYSLSLLYKANIDSFASTNWFKEKTLCQWKGIFCNSEKKIEMLDLSAQKLSVIPPFSFIGLPFLRSLDLPGNQLTSLEANTFNGLSNLQWLDLSGNQLTTVKTNSFVGLAKLQYLNLYQNQLTTLEANAFNGLSSLFSLNLHQNQLTTLEANAFVGLFSLKILDLHDNQLLTFLPKELCNDRSIRVLYANTQVTGCQ